MLNNSNDNEIDLHENTPLISIRMVVLGNGPIRRRISGDPQNRDQCFSPFPERKSTELELIFYPAFEKLPDCRSFQDLELQLVMLTQQNYRKFNPATK